MIIDSSRIDRENAYGTFLSNSDIYVSWVGSGATKNPTVFQGTAMTFDEDRVAGWKGPHMGQDMNGDDIHHPNRWVALKNLDTAAMMQAWANIRNKPGGHWKLVDKNCATVVYRVLKEGCRGVGAGVPWYKWKAAHQLVWWPSDLIDYAKSLDGFVYDRS
jgi:hypothetical protein